MADFEFIFQAVSKTTHASAINALLGLKHSKRVLISVAFATEDGVAALESALQPHSGISECFVGIRNGITSSQALIRLLQNCGDLYAVDTGSRDVIFHPKIYLALDEDEARLILGSANLTFGGLHNNIEASTRLTLDLKDKAEKAFVDGLLDTFKQLPSSHHKHVFKITSKQQIQELLDAGRLVDERLVSHAPKDAPTTKGKTDGLPRMSLYRVKKPASKTKPVSAIAVAKGKKPAKAAAIAVAPFADFQLVWRSKPLTRRDLNIPKAKKTNKTGSMLWKLGAMVGIDQRHYFRDEVFGGLAWKVDPKRTHYERVTAIFELVISNVNHGKFHLVLSHNTKTSTKSYKQKNAMTNIRWGDAQEFIAKPNLLGRHMNLYRNESDITQFIIEID